MNLLEETLQIIETSGHTPNDIVFIGSADGEYACTWDEFEDLADVDYDDGFGTAYVALDLIVEFSDGRRLYRVEYDGSEEWAYMPVRKHHENPKRIYNLFGCYETLASVNEAFE